MEQQLVQEASRLLEQARAEGERRGYDRAVQELGSVRPSFLISSVFADAMEQAAARLEAEDGATAEAMRAQAAQLRLSVAAPEVATFEPGDGAGDVPRGLNPRVQFSLDVQRPSAENVTIQAASGGAPLAAAVEYDPASRTATLVPANGLRAGVQYRVTVDGVRSAHGTRMRAPHSWTFTTLAS